jgi:hypothetical protein
MMYLATQKGAPLIEMVGTFARVVCAKQLCCSLHSMRYAKASTDHITLILLAFCLQGIMTANNNA